MENDRNFTTTPLLDENNVNNDNLVQPSCSHSFKQERCNETIDPVNILPSDKLSLRFSKETDDFQVKKEARKDSQSSSKSKRPNTSIDIEENTSLKSHISSKSKTRESTGSTSRRSFPSILTSEIPRLSIITFLNNITAPAPSKKRISRGSTTNSKHNRQEIIHCEAQNFVKQKVDKGADGSDKTLCKINVPSVESSGAEKSGVCSNDSFVSASSVDLEDTEMLECNICYYVQSINNFFVMHNCSHCTCKSCLLKYLSIEIMESRTEISCLECSQPMNASDIYKLLAPEHSFLLERYEWFSLRRSLLTDSDVRWCPAPDCNYAVIAKDCAKCPQLYCGRSGCNTSFCYNCKNYWHEGISCEKASERMINDIIASIEAIRGKRKNKLGDPTGFPSVNVSTQTAVGASAAVHVEDMETIGIDPKLVDGEMKCCPRCNVLIMKLNDGSCNHMSCTMCGTEFCWLCLKQINELHYLSPTGCTFWGKRPWSRKKKLLWQIGTLIGAPVGIALTAALAIPGIIIGVPIFVGRKVYQRFSNTTRGRRNTITALSVFGSLIVAPVLAIMAVGVGVPIMLAYVYGVIPLSLCRNGACGGGGGSEMSVTEDDVSDVYSYGEEAVQNTTEAEQLDLLTASRRRNVRPSRQRHSRLLLSAAREKSPSRDPTQRVSIITKQKTTSKCKMFDKAVQNPAKVNKKPPIGRNAASSPLHDSVGSGESSVQNRSKRRLSAPGNRRLSSPSTFKCGGGSVRTTATCESGDKLNGTRKVYQGQGALPNHYRRQSNESSGITSLGAGNAEDASIRAIAGSQYAYDARSVYTLARCVDLEAASYNEETASTIACCGGIPERRSLSGGGSFKATSSMNLVKAETAASPVASIARPRSSMSRSPSQQIQQLVCSSYTCNLSPDEVPASSENVDSDLQLQEGGEKKTFTLRKFFGQMFSLGGHSSGGE